MKTIKIISAILMMASIAMAKPSPKNPNEKPVKVHVRESKDRQKTESLKEAKVAKKKIKYNNMRYKQEARERKHFNNM